MKPATEYVLDVEPAESAGATSAIAGEYDAEYDGEYTGECGVCGAGEYDGDEDGGEAAVGTPQLNGATML